jgi:hypothetical protein
MVEVEREERRSHKPRSEWTQRRHERRFRALRLECLSNSVPVDPGVATQTRIVRHYGVGRGRAVPVLRSEEVPAQMQELMGSEP